MKLYNPRKFVPGMCKIACNLTLNNFHRVPFDFHFIKEFDRLFHTAVPPFLFKFFDDMEIKMDFLKTF